jgi:hypothetical protein
VKRRVSNALHIITSHHVVRDATQSIISVRCQDFRYSKEESVAIPLIERRSIKYADAIITVSQFTKQQIATAYGVLLEKIRAAYAATSLDGYDSCDFAIEQLDQAQH